MSLQDTDDDEVQCCKKNPGHKTFLNLETCLNLDEEFVQRLPSTYRGDKVLIKDLIEFFTDLTVKIESCVTTGTGFIFNVRFSAHDGTLDKCTCDKCRGQDNSTCVRGELYVRTAEHVITWGRKNSLEDTRCILFYNSKVEVGVDVVAVRVERLNNNDTVCIVCFTCEFKIIKRLTGILDKFYNIKLKLSRRKLTKRESKDRYAIIVSHPHGKHKHVTIGPYFLTKMPTRAVYKADTCDRSSGANIFILGGPEEAGPLVHTGELSNGKETFNVGNTYKLLNTFKSDGFFRHAINCFKRCVTEFFNRNDSNINMNE